MRFALIISLLLATQSLAAQVETDTTAATADTSAFVMGKSPLGAVIRSAILPGLGQFYNESYWKIPIVLGVSGFLVYGYATEHDTYAQYRDLYAASITETNPSGDLRLKQFREFYRDRRDTYAWWFAVTYLLQIADAFVDAHLYDFDVSEKGVASIRVQGVGRIGLQIRF